MTDPKRYTLDEAREVLAHDECVARGHDFRIITSDAGGAPQNVWCVKCGRTWAVKGEI